MRSEAAPVPELSDILSNVHHYYASVVCDQVLRNSFGRPPAAELIDAIVIDKALRSHSIYQTYSEQGLQMTVDSLLQRTREQAISDGAWRGILQKFETGNDTTAVRSHPYVASSTDPLRQQLLGAIELTEKADRGTEVTDTELDKLFEQTVTFANSQVPYRQADEELHREVSQSIVARLARCQERGDAKNVARYRRILEQGLGGQVVLPGHEAASSPPASTAISPLSRPETGPKHRRPEVAADQPHITVTTPTAWGSRKRIAALTLATTTATLVSAQAAAARPSMTSPSTADRAPDHSATIQIVPVIPSPAVLSTITTSPRLVSLPKTVASAAPSSESHPLQVSAPSQAQSAATPETMAPVATITPAKPAVVMVDQAPVAPVVATSNPETTVPASTSEPIADSVSPVSPASLAPETSPSAASPVSDSAQPAVLLVQSHASPSEAVAYTPNPSVIASVTRQAVTANVIFLAEHGTTPNVAAALPSTQPVAEAVAVPAVPDSPYKQTAKKVVADMGLDQPGSAVNYSAVVALNLLDHPEQMTADDSKLVDDTTFVKLVATHMQTTMNQFVGSANYSAEQQQLISGLLATALEQTTTPAQQAKLLATLPPAVSPPSAPVAPAQPATPPHHVTAPAPSKPAAKPKAPETPSSEAKANHPYSLNKNQLHIIDQLDLEARQKQLLKQLIVAAMSRVQAGDRMNPQAVIGQAILESGWASSDLASVYGNLFGQKADDNWHGPTVNIWTSEQNGDGSVYRTVATWEVYQTNGKADFGKAFDNYALRIGNAPEYRDAMACAHDGPEAYLRALEGKLDFKTCRTVGKELMYATDVDYVSKVMNIIRSVHLPAIIAAGQKVVIPHLATPPQPATNLNPAPAATGTSAADGRKLETIIDQQAWHDGSHGATDARPSYLAAQQVLLNRNKSAMPYTEQFHVTSGGADCGNFVAEVLRLSGVDPNVPAVGTYLQRPYYDQHPEIYKKIPNQGKNTKFQAGAMYVFVVNAGSGAGGSGHTWFQFGNDIYGKHAAGASLDDQMPYEQSAAGYLNADQRSFDDGRGPYSIYEVQ